MIKLPEPVGKVAHEDRPYEPAWISSEDAYTESQLKQAVRDALEEAAKECEWLAVNVVPHGDAYVAKNCGKRIRALIKEIPA